MHVEPVHVHVAPAPVAAPQVHFAPAPQVQHVHVQPAPGKDEKYILKFVTFDWNTMNEEYVKIWVIASNLFGIKYLELHSLIQINVLMNVYLSCSPIRMC